MSLHVENKLTLTAELCLSELRLESGFWFEFKQAAAFTGRGIGGVKRKQCARRAASGNEKIAAANAQAFRVLGRRLVRQPVAGTVGRRERNRLEFAVRRLIQFYRQPFTFGINHVFHETSIDQQASGANTAYRFLFDEPLT